MTQGKIRKVSVSNEGIIVSVATGIEEEVEAEYIMPHDSIWMVPERGDIVNVERRGSDIICKPTGRRKAPSGLSEGDVHLKLNEDTELLFEKDGGNYNLSITCDGDVNIDGSSISIGEDGEQLPLQSHTHTGYDGEETGSANGGTTSTKVE